MAKTLKDMLTEASQKPEFASEVIANPSKFQEEYQLTDDQLACISAAGLPVGGGVHPMGYESS
jgi:hypothetical protein